MSVLFRSAEWDTPWWVRPNRSPGRWNRVGDPPTQYLCSHPLAVFAERARSLGEAFVADLDTARWRCWAADVDLATLDVVGFENAEHYEISAADLVSDDHSASQCLAERLRQRGSSGLLAPSAALPGTHVVALFGPRVAAPWGAEPVDPAIEIPTAHTAERSVVPDEVASLIRWPGKEHAGYAAWLGGEDFLPDLPWPTTVGPVA